MLKSGGPRETLARLLAGVTGQAFIRAGTLIQAIVLVPVLIGSWGVENYGGWLTATALGSYVGLTNFGLSGAAAAGILLAAGAGDEARARRVFCSALAGLAMVSLPVLGAVALLAFNAPLGAWLNLSGVAPSTLSVLLCLVALQVWIDTVKGPVVTAVCAVGHYGLPNVITGCAKLLEVALIAVSVLFWRGGFVEAGQVVVGVAALDLGVQLAVMRWRVPWARFSLAEVDMELLKGLIKPSLGNLLLQSGVSAVVVQGPRVLLSIVAGPAAVALFATHATALRLAEQFNALLAGPIQMETASAVGGGRRRRAVRLMAMASQFNVVATLSLVVALMLVGPWLFDHWTLGRIAYDYPLAAAVAVAVVVSGFGKISVLTVIGTNRMFVPALVMLPLTLTAIAVGTVLAISHGGVGMAVGWALAELAVAAVALWAAAGVVEVAVGPFLLRLLDPRETVERLASLRELMAERRR